MSEVLIPTVDLERYQWERERGRPLSDETLRDCGIAAQAFVELGVCNVRDPRFPKGLDSAYQRATAEIFALPDAVKHGRFRRADLHHQVDWTPELVEQARDHTELIEREISAEHRPLPWPVQDLKERIFVPAPDNERPEQTAFPGLNQPCALIDAYPEWGACAVLWRGHMLQAITTFVEMLAIGLDAPPDIFTRLMRCAPHLLAPTGTNVRRFGRPGAVWAKFHYDFNLVTGHGKANLPGLYAWTRDWRRFPVRVPQDCFLMQAGKQLWWLTGGRIMYGFHEVVCREEMMDAVRAFLAAGNDWRVTSTVFAHVASDQWLEVLPPFRRVSPDLSAFPRVQAGQMSYDEIKAIGL